MCSYNVPQLHNVPCAPHCTKPQTRAAPYAIWDPFRFHPICGLLQCPDAQQNQSHKKPKTLKKMLWE